MKTRNTAQTTATATVTINAALCAASAACIRVGVPGTRREVYLPLEEIVSTFGGIPSAVTITITASDDAVILPVAAHADMLTRTADLKAAGDRAAALNAGAEILSQYGLIPPARYTPKVAAAPVQQVAPAPQTVTRTRRVTTAPATPAPVQQVAAETPAADPRVDALELGMITLTSQLAALTAALTGQAATPPPAPTKGRVRK